MKTFKILSLLIAVVLVNTSAFAWSKIKNAKTEIVAIEGISETCKNLIEQAANKKNISQIEWNMAAGQAQLTYDTHKTTKENILKQIALAGFDNESYLAPKTAYAKLGSECYYKGVPEAIQPVKTEITHENPMLAASKLEPVYTFYFIVKDALVASDFKSASQNSQKLEAAVKAVKMGELTSAEHDVWMAVMHNIQQEVTALSKAKDLAAQRKAFARLSPHIYSLLKTSETSYKVYYDFCPMYENGSYWLSKEKAISNPFYGSQMMTCGSVKEIVK